MLRDVITLLRPTCTLARSPLCVHFTQGLCCRAVEAKAVPSHFVVPLRANLFSLT